MGTPAAQCKGNVGGHFTVSGAAPSDHPPLRRWRSTSRQYATVPSGSCLESVYAQAGGDCDVGQSTGRMLVLC